VVILHLDRWCVYPEAAADVMADFMVSGFMVSGFMV
jgi:hypothetical protein